MTSRRLGLLCLFVVPLAPVQAAEKEADSFPLTISAGAAPSLPADNRPPRLFVLAVGINAYPAKERLSYAVKDARELTQVLRSKGGKVYGAVETKLLTDKEADRQGILDGIAWLQREVSAQDTAIIFYSGHGARHPDVGFFLVPARFKDAQPLKTMVSGTELKRAAREVRGPVVVMLDCCHAGAILNERPRFGLQPPLDLTATLVSMEVDKATPRLGILCAARGGEESEENSTIHHGIFTKVLLQALAGKADANSDGVVTLGEVERFVKQRLPRASKGQQHAMSTCSALPPATPLARQ